MLKALDDCLGIVSHACDACNIARETHYSWLQNDESYRIKVDDILEKEIDFVEKSLHSQIRLGDTTAIIFFLKTKGKKVKIIVMSDETIKGTARLKEKLKIK